jgi:multidrug efflux system outer membrane protein
MSRPPPLLAAPLVALAAGCAVAPPVSHPELGIAVPAAFLAAPPGDEVAVPEAFWWRSFGDPELEGIITEALAHNQDLKLAASRVLAAAAQARIAGADRLPQVGLGFEASRAQQNFIGLPIPGGEEVLTTRFTRFGASLDVSWELDVWGRIRAGQAAALADRQAAEADLAAARLSIIGQTVKTWFGAIEARRQVELAEATVENYRISSEQIEDRYRRGLRPPLDLRFALTNLAAAEAVLAARREQFERVRRQLEALLGRYPGATIDASSALPAPPAPVPPGLPSELVRRRPDLASAERRLAAAESRLTEARRARLPRISLSASGGTASTQLADLVDGDFSVWRLAGNLLQPIFQGGRLAAGVDLASSGADQALAAYVQSALVAFTEVENSLAAETYLARREQALLRAVEQAQAARRLAEERYGAGLDDVLTLLEAQRSAFDAESQLLGVSRLRLDVRVDLHLALGGGFSLEEGAGRELETAERDEGAAEP